jgi:hypothetical protein
MIRLIIKLAIAALVANAAWRVGSAYMSFYRFKDAVTETAQFGVDKTEDQLRQRVLELAGDYGLPITENSFSVRKEEARTYLTGSYTQPVEVVPGYRYPWAFSWNVETLDLGGAKIQPLVPKRD